MGLINYDSFTIDQLKTIKDNIDRRLKDNNSTITPSPAYIKVISNVDMADSLDKKGFMHNKFSDGVPDHGSSIDETVEQNSYSASGSIAYSFGNSIYNYYNTNKESLRRNGRVNWAYNLHGIRPLFLFKE